MTTLPITPQYFWTLVALLGVLGLSVVIFGALSGLGNDHRPPLWEQVSARWQLPTILMGLLWLGLFFLTIAAAFVGVWQAIQPEGKAVQPGLGLGALLAALLGAPFVIWGTWLKYQTVRYQKEGHITDRINKAVEQLGAEKKVDRIGRPVTIWMGEVEEYEATGDAARSLMEKPRTKVVPKAWKGLEGAIEQAFDMQDLHLVRTWSSERTVIEYKGEALALAKDEVVGSEGAWDVFSETVPNIEVRIGAILSLERIAQDSTIHDRGRDHLRVMEILCAYIRENAKCLSMEVLEYEKAPTAPRLDIQTVANVIKRRGKQQLKIEEEAKFRLDLRSTDLRGIDFSNGILSAALLWNCRLEFANFEDADLRGTQFSGSIINFTWWRGADLAGAILDRCILNLPKPVPGGMVRGTPLLGKARGVSVVSADLTAMDYFGEDPLAFFGSGDTKLHHNNDDLRDDAQQKRREIERLTRLGDVSAADELSSHVSKNPFRDWAPYDGTDMAIGFIRAKLRENIGLIGWPHSD